MKVKEFCVEAKKSRNFQTYTVSITAETTDESYEEDILKAQAKCRKLANDQIKLDVVN